MIKMKTWLYFYIEHTVKNGKYFYKESGWSIWCNYFDYSYECGSEYLVLSELMS